MLSQIATQQNTVIIVHTFTKVVCFETSPHEENLMNKKSYFHDQCTCGLYSSTIKGWTTFRRKRHLQERYHWKAVICNLQDETINMSGDLSSSSHAGTHNGRYVTQMLPTLLSSQLEVLGVQMCVFFSTLGPLSGQCLCFEPVCPECDWCIPFGGCCPVCVNNMIPFCRPVFSCNWRNIRLWRMLHEHPSRHKFCVITVNNFRYTTLVLYIIWITFQHTILLHVLPLSKKVLCKSPSKFEAWSFAWNLAC